MEISVKEARSKFSSLLTQVKEGEEVVIRRRGKEVARLLPPPNKRRRLPSLKDFRASIHIKGKPLSAVLRQARDEDRY